MAVRWHGEGAEQWSRMRGIAPRYTSAQLISPRSFRADGHACGGGREYCCRRVNPARPISLADGDIRTAEAWAHAPWTEDFVDIEGERKEQPEWQTRVKMLWDDDALYVGAWMEVRIDSSYLLTYAPRRLRCCLLTPDVVCRLSMACRSAPFVCRSRV